MFDEDIDEDIDVLMTSNGGYWGEHPDHTVGDWKYEVANEETRLGYWQWVQALTRL